VRTVRRSSTEREQRKAVEESRGNSNAVRVGAQEPSQPSRWVGPGGTAGSAEGVEGTDPSEPPVLL
jgi:hypothetical protein